MQCSVVGNTGGKAGTVMELCLVMDYVRPVEEVVLLTFINLVSIV